MRSRILIIFAMISALSLAANAQIGNITKKIPGTTKREQSKPQPTPPSSASATKPRYEDKDFLYMGRNDMDGEKVGGLHACVLASDQLPPPVSKTFAVWSNNISEVAALRSFQSSSCPVIAFWIHDNPQYKWKNIDSLTETAQGNSIYKVQADKLVLVRKVEASQFYIVIVPDHNKPALKLADLRMCGYPDTIKLFRRKVDSVSNCHDQKQKLYVFEKYKQYPGPMQTSSVIFDAEEFSQLNRQGKFRGLAVYKLVGEELVPVR